MARYFFSLSYRDKTLPDREGVELQDDVDLGTCALYLASRLRTDTAIPEFQFPGCTIEVANARGEVLLKVPVPVPQRS